MWRIRHALATLLVLAMVVVIVAGCGGQDSGNAGGSSDTGGGTGEQTSQADTQFPTKPLEFIVPWAAGGSTDLLARAIAASVEKVLGQPVVVVNKPGAGGEVGFTAIAQAKADGYTVGIASTPAMLLITLDRQASYSLDDFRFIVGLVQEPQGLLVRADSPFRTLEDLIEYARTNPGKLQVGHSGVGTTTQFAILDMADKAGIQVTDVPFDGTSEALAALLGGHVDVVSASLGEGRNAIKSGQARLLTVFDNERAPEYPDVPTAKETGLDVVHVAVRGVMVPRDVPEDIYQVLVRAFTEAASRQEYLDKINELGQRPRVLTADEFEQVVRSHREVYAPLVERVKKSQ